MIGELERIWKQEAVLLWYHSPIQPLTTSTTLPYWFFYLALNSEARD
jgi:hypothetical protein